MKMPSDIIREEIVREGEISFARFMELALYCPETGYYETEKDIVGCRGDFITSVSVGSLFGELLAFQFAEWLDRITKFDQLKIVEAGAHDGKLAADILNWLRQYRPKLFSQVEYVILEPSPRRQQWQQKTLSPFSNVRWLERFNASTSPGVNGVIFGNELLDAFPVRRWGWDAREKKWFEWGVTLHDDRFCWARILLRPQDLPFALRQIPTSLLEVLSDGYVLETSPAAEGWWREAAAALSHGKLLAIDYGYKDDEQIFPARLKGTLRAYYRHRVSDDLLAYPGQQDLTAHVNFSAIQRVGEEAGLKTGAWLTQPQFLTRILDQSVRANAFAGLDAKQTRQFHTLTHPEHLGRSFRVLMQER